MQLSALLAGADVVRMHASPELPITSIVSDSRRAVPGSLFLCLHGTRTDGHRYIGDAAARGASAVLIDADCQPPDLPYAAVRDTRAAAAVVWNNWWGDPTRHMRVVAVTGTNGKTSTSFLLRAILEDAGYKTGLIGTVRCLCGSEPLDIGGGGEISDMPAAMTTPDPEYLYGAAAQMKEKGAEVLIFEATSHALAQHKPDAVRIDLGMFTNLSPEHLDYHGTMEEYLRAKARLFTMCPDGIVNADDPYAERIMAASPSCSFTRISASPGKEPEAECRALHTRLLGIDGVEYVYSAPNTVFRLRCPVPGQFTVSNSLMAVTAALRFGVDPITIQDALRSFHGVEGRMERVLLPGAPFSVFIDYAHTPAALETLLRTVRAARRPEQRITLLFGCGGDRDPAKRPAMGHIASALADRVIVTSDNSRTEKPENILGDILRGIDQARPHTVIPDRREAIRCAVAEARPGDILLLAGKGHEKYEIRADGKHPFDEAEIVRAAYAEQSGGKLR
ncbi:MAG: UDP-N-acetylmuramoyl-L-alanyl-D-glutamate--2,6-diaminopimelate ligase [Eubacteriales bacterium]